MLNQMHQTSVTICIEPHTQAHVCMFHCVTFDLQEKSGERGEFYHVSEIRAERMYFWKKGLY